MRPTTSRNLISVPARLSVAIQLFCLMTMLSSATVAAELLEEAIDRSIDWQPIELVPAAQANLKCRQCGGLFVDPLAGVDTTTPPEDSELQVSADRSDGVDGILNLEGNVSLTQGYRRITADSLTINRSAQTTQARGHVVLREPGVVVTSAVVDYNRTTQVAEIDAAHFVLHAQQISGSAAHLKRLPNGIIEITDGAITYCAPIDPHWQLKTGELELNPGKGVGTARNATIEVAGIPVFYTPWIQFPLDDRRKTGLLFPDIGSDSRGGLDITAPIYLNLAPNYDATYSPRYIDERGLNHQLETRWLSPDVGYWSVNSAWLGSDDKYSAEIGESSDRWLANIEHRGNFSENWRTRIDYSKVSDVDYLRDLNNVSLSAQRQTALIQLGEVDYLGEDWLINIQAQQFQSLADDIRDDYKKLPQITAQWRGTSDWGGFEPIATAQYSQFDSDTNRVTGQRLYAEAGLTYPMRWQFAFLRPTVKYRALAYELDNQTPLLDASPTAGSAVASIDAGLFFERQTKLGSRSMTQTLEPRAFYLYSEYDAQTALPDFDSAELTFDYNQLYRDTRFSGNDRLDDANQLSFGLTTRFFDNEDGRERLNASIGQIYYFRDRDVRLNGADPRLTEGGSAIAVEFNWLPSSTWNLRSSVLYDPFDDKFDAASAQLGFNAGDGKILNVGYTLREPPPSLLERPVTEQANLSGYYPLDDNWSLFGAVEYSLEASESVEDMIGIEYDDCCWQVRLLYMRYVDTASDIVDFTDPNLQREHALQFQVVLKGMGGFGGRVDNLMRDMIRGFSNRY